MVFIDQVAFVTTYNIRLTDLQIIGGELNMLSW